jgi:hypothetical protein
MGNKQKQMNGAAPLGDIKLSTSDEPKMTLTRGMRHELKEAWKKFINGHWEKTFPEKAGVYPTATREGCRATDRHVALIRGGHLVDTTSYRPIDKSTTWAGWWWSEPIPALPPPPDWETEYSDESVLEEGEHQSDDPAVKVTRGSHVV